MQKAAYDDSPCISHGRNCWDSERKAFAGLYQYRKVPIQISGQEVCFIFHLFSYLLILTLAFLNVVDIRSWKWNHRQCFTASLSGWKHFRMFSSHFPKRSLNPLTHLAFHALFLSQENPFMFYKTLRHGEIIISDDKTTWDVSTVWSIKLCVMSLACKFDGILHDEVKKVEENFHRSGLHLIGSKDVEKVKVLLAIWFDLTKWSC